MAHFLGTARATRGSLWTGSGIFTCTHSTLVCVYSVVRCYSMLIYVGTEYRNRVYIVLLLQQLSVCVYVC